jgi:hypothetical protein
MWRARNTSMMFAAQTHRVQHGVAEAHLVGITEEITFASGNGPDERARIVPTIHPKRRSMAR